MEFRINVGIETTQNKTIELLPNWKESAGSGHFTLALYLSLSFNVGPFNRSANEWGKPRNARLFSALADWYFHGHSDLFRPLGSDQNYRRFVEADRAMLKFIHHQQHHQHHLRHLRRLSWPMIDYRNYQFGITVTSQAHKRQMDNSSTCVCVCVCVW